MKPIQIIYGASAGIKALEILSATLLEYLGAYPACFRSDDIIPESDTRKLYIGTKADNRYLAKKSTASLIHPEEYCIRVADDEILIEGADEGGVLYGAIDFYNRYILPHETNHIPNSYFENIFEKPLPDFFYTSHPSVANRGIWTWGYPILDYRGFLDNMAKLKLNTLIVWNDYLPVNAEEFVRYAHLCNIKIIWGFAWLWDTNCKKFDLSSLQTATDEIVETYKKEFLHSGGDGIYFQSFTELQEERIDGILIAEAVTDFVNRTAERIFALNPDLELQFGLHATSVREQLEHLEKVDSRIRIVWEDCGAFPFAYLPSDVKNFEETISLTDRIVKLRGETERFGTVLKGFTNLNWNTFSHQAGPYVLGTASRKTINQKEAEKKRIWRYVQAYWLANADKAYEMIINLQKNTNPDSYITALVEDGLLEKHLYFPVALFAEMLWDCNTDLKKLMTEVSLRPDVTFA